MPGVAAALVGDQVARGYDVCVASPPSGDLQRAAERLGARWLSWPAERSPGPSTLGETRRLSKLIAAASPELVHLHSAKAGLAGRLALRGERATVFQPHAWSFEAADGALRRAVISWERFAVRWSDVVVCVSEGERERGVSEGVDARYEVIPNGVDLTRYAAAGEADRAAARSALGLGDEPLAVVVGRLSHQKGQDTLLSAWPRVLDRVPDARLALVGDGPSRAELEGIGAARVVFVGDSDEVGRWLAAASVVVQPSRWEGMSLSLIEAIARARSVVVTDVVGMREVVVDGAGAVVPPDVPAALADAVVERLADPGLAALEGAAGRALAEQRYDVRRVCERVVAVYDGVLERRRRAGT